MTFREIRGVRRRGAERRRWFQDGHFDLFLTQDCLGRVQWFQLCYRRDTPRERVLEWRRGRGFVHLQVTQPRFAADSQAGELVADGAMPHQEVLQRFEASAAGLPAELAAFVAGKVREHERPSWKYRRPGTRPPRWLARLRRGL